MVARVALINLCQHLFYIAGRELVLYGRAELLADVFDRFATAC
jgi:hypothetical protein